MALPSSGTMTLAMIQGEYGGSNPIGINEYYRNGAYVPNSISTTTTVTEGPFYSASVYSWSVEGTFVAIYWNSATILQANYSGTSYVSGIYTYYRGTFQFSNKGISWYAVYRTYQSTVTTYVNQSVPTSGQISFNQFYGGRKT